MTWLHYLTIYFVIAIVVSINQYIDFRKFAKKVKISLHPSFSDNTMAFIWFVAIIVVGLRWPEHAIRYYWRRYIKKQKNITHWMSFADEKKLKETLEEIGPMEITGKEMSEEKTVKFTMVEYHERTFKTTLQDYMCNSCVFIKKTDPPCKKCAIEDAVKVFIDDISN